jgi:WD40 repeat protein
MEQGGTSVLSLLDPDGSVEEIFQLPEGGTFSLAWAPRGDSLVYGFEGPDGRGIRVYAVGTGTSGDVGCSASSVAYSWGLDDWLVVGDQDNHYVVERSGCGTIESIDARKLHEVAFSPDGARVAYLLRELEYDREARNYQPDSSLYVAHSTGTDPIMVVGDRYKARRATWSPDSKSLAFDARLPEEAHRRLISIYDVEQRQSVFLTPKAVKSDVSQWAASWSPNGQTIAYLEADEGKEPRVMIRDLAGSFSKGIGEAGERFGGWLSENRVVLSSPGKTRVVDREGRTLFESPEEAFMIAVQRRYPAGE